MNIKQDTKKQEKIMGLFLLMVAAFTVHIICALAYTGYDTDMRCFSYWSNAVFENGFSKFYKLEVFTDYPPGYMYILYVIGAIRSIIGAKGLETVSILLLKLPAIICDLGIGYFIYKVASKHTKHTYALLFASAYMFNPAVIINSATWGQVDSVFTLCVFLMCYFVTEKKLPFAYFIFAIGILIKPQTLIFTPVLIYGIIDQVFLKDFSVKRMMKELLLGLAAIALLFLLAAPYGLEEVISQYIDTMGSYEYASVNAYNFWTMIGKNWTPQTDTFIFMSYKSWGTFFILAIVVLSAVFNFKCKDSESKYYFTGAFIVFAMFTLSVRMHERYMYPAMALFLAGTVVRCDIKHFAAYVSMCIAHFLNVYHVLMYYDPSTYDFSNPVLPLVSFLNVAAFVFVLVVLYQDMTGEVRVKNSEVKNTAANNTAANKKVANNKSVNEAREFVNEVQGMWRIRPSHKSAKWTKLDFIIVASVTVLYAALAFWRLGDMDAPQTEWMGTHGDVISVDMGETKYVDHLYCYLGNYEGREFDVEYSIDGSNWMRLVPSEGDVIKIESVFRWNEVPINKDLRYIRYTCAKNEGDQFSIMEMMYYDADGNVISPVNTSDYPELYDEQDIFDGVYSYKNSTYFDEIYHARTAYEMIKGRYCYENTHPPLGKAIMAIGILIFGMCPFGWRFMGTLFGVLMIPVMYMIAKKMTDKTWISTIFMLLFTFDFMHFTQTRIATIDVFVTLFIMLEYYFMLCYYRMSFYDTPLKKTFVPLALSGIFMGLGFGAKWTGIYAGAGLALIFFTVIFRRYMEYKKASEKPRGKTEGIDHKYIIENFSLYTMKTLCFCVVSFVIVPFILYLMAYIPYNDGTDRGLMSRMMASQNTMFSYHSELVAEHPYSSTWYEWPTMVRPMLYYVEDVGNDLHEGISAMGNPLVWWVGILAFVYMLYLVIRKKDRIAFFLSVGYLAQYVPWMLVSRCTFIYHYFPSVPFIVMMIGYSIYLLTKDSKKRAIAAWVYVVAAVALFVLFFPVISGYPATLEYAKLVKWFSGWALLF